GRTWGSCSDDASASAPARQRGSLSTPRDRRSLLRVCIWVSSDSGTLLLPLEKKRICCFFRNDGLSRTPRRRTTDARGCHRRRTQRRSRRGSYAACLSERGSQLIEAR